MKSYKITESEKPLVEINHETPIPVGKQVLVKTIACGVCHSDCHLGLNELGGSIFPMVPGHELIGTVTEVGSSVTKVKVGDNVGVGVIKDACLVCGTCKSDDE